VLIESAGEKVTKATDVKNAWKMDILGALSLLIVVTLIIVVAMVFTNKTSPDAQ